MIGDATMAKFLKPLLYCAPSRLRAAFRSVAAAANDRVGMAATEFALILPIMGVIFFGMLEASDALMMNRRVANAANSLVDLIGQEAEITAPEIDDVMVGVTKMLDPTSASTVDMKVTSVIVDPNNPGNIIVDWSRDNHGATPYAKASTYTKLDDSTIVHASASLVVVEMDYTYVSGLTNKVLSSPFNFSRVVSRWPRQSAKVILCGSSPLPACTGA